MDFFIEYQGKGCLRQKYDDCKFILPLSGAESEI